MRNIRWEVDFDEPTYRLWNNDYLEVEIMHHVYTWFCKGYYPHAIAETLEICVEKVVAWIDKYERSYKYGENTVSTIR